MHDIRFSITLLVNFWIYLGLIFRFLFYLRKVTSGKGILTKRDERIVRQSDHWTQLRSIRSPAANQWITIRDWTIPWQTEKSRRQNTFLIHYRKSALCLDLIVAGRSAGAIVFVRILLIPHRRRRYREPLGRSNRSLFLPSYIAELRTTMRGKWEWEWSTYGSAYTQVDDKCT